MNRKELVEEVCKSVTDISKKEVALVVDLAFDVITKTVKAGEEVRLSPFGIFAKKEYAARAGVNPATGEKIAIKARTRPTFKPSKAFIQEVTLN